MTNDDEKDFKKWASKHYRITHFLRGNQFASVPMEINFREVMKDQRAKALLVQLLLKFGAGKMLVNISEPLPGDLRVTRPVFMADHIHGTRPSKHMHMIEFIKALLKFTRTNKDRVGRVKGNLSTVQAMLDKINNDLEKWEKNNG